MSFQEDAQKYGPVNATILESWTDLCEKGDRSSPEEYPDHCLITYDELADYMRAMRKTVIEECAAIADTNDNYGSCGGIKQDIARKIRALAQ